MTPDASKFVPVCAHCRTPLGAGMTVAIFHPDQWRAFLVQIERPDPYDDDDPIVVCRHCGDYMRQVLREARPQ